MVLLLAHSLGLIVLYYLNIIQGTVFTHFYYVPIVLACIWWRRNGILVAIFLSLAVIASHFILHKDVPAFDNFIRAFFFLFVGSVVAYLTERHERSVKNILHSQANLSAILESSVQSFLLINRKFIVRDCNDKARDYFMKYHGNALNIGDSVIEHIWDYRKSAFRENFNKALKGEPVTYEWQLKGLDDKPYWIELTMSPVAPAGRGVSGVCLSINDITKRKETEIALASNEEKFRKLLKYSMDIIAIVAKEGTLKYVSPSVERLLNYREDQLIGEGIFDYIHPDDHEKIEKVFINSISKGGITYAPEIRLKKSDGSWMLVETIGNNMLDDPLIKGIVVNVRDISRRKAGAETKE